MEHWKVKKMPKNTGIADIRAAATALVWVRGAFSTEGPSVASQCPGLYRSAHWWNLPYTGQHTDIGRAWAGLQKGCLP